MHITPALLGRLYYASEWAIRLVMLVYVPQRRTAAATRTWLLLIFLLPWPGLAIYALFGRIRVPHLRREKQARSSEVVRREESERLAARSGLGAVPSAYDGAARLAFELGDFVPLAGNSIELFADYSGWIARLVSDIDEARSHVHLLFYIFEDDATGRSVADALVRAAGRGVNCRVLIDAVGGEGGLRHLDPRMRASGIEVNAMLPVGLFRRSAGRFDLRNHRKIAIIDGRLGHVGSQNIVDPTFLPEYPNEELMAGVVGPVVAQLQAVFMIDWFLETNQRLDFDLVMSTAALAGATSAQVLPSGPGYPRENTRDLFITLLYSARSRVVITTPYFIPDEPFLQAMRAAAMRGVTMHLVVSKNANQPFTQFAQRAYYEDLLDAGVKIHLYRPRFLHAKHLSIDDQVAVFGSTNIDIRSFALNAEISLVAFDPAVVGDLARIQERYFANSDLLDPEEWNRRSLGVKVAQNVARLADSLL